MSVTLIKGNSLKFGTYGFEHINLPAGRPKYWDSIKVARIADSKTFSEPRFGVTLEKSPPGPAITHRFDYDEVSYIVHVPPSAEVATLQASNMRYLNGAFVL